MAEFVHVGNKLLPIEEGANSETIQAALDAHQKHRFARNCAEGRTDPKRAYGFKSSVGCRRTGGSRKKDH